MFLTRDPRPKSLLINRQIFYSRTAKQFIEYFYHFGHVRKNKLIHSFRISLAGISIEINPVPVGTKHEHTCLRHRIARRNAGLNHQIRTPLAAGTQIQNLRIAIVIGDRTY